METRKHIIEANETFLAIVEDYPLFSRKLRRYAMETPFFGRALTDADLLDELRMDEIIEVLRVNTETWAVEDITEQAARKYLYAMDEKEGVELDDEDRFPAYVKNSRAWSLWRDDLEAERPVQPDPDRAYDERRDRLASPSLDFRGEIPALASAVGRKMEEA